MRITGTVITESKLGDNTLGSRIERVAHERMTIDTRSERTRVHVEMLPDGSALVTTFRLAPGADPRDPDTIVWNEDAHVTLPIWPEQPTHVSTTEHTTITLNEPLPF